MRSCSTSSGGHTGCRARTAALAVAVVVLTGCGGGGTIEGAPPSAPDRIALRSPAFADGATLPARFTCSGAGDSPPLRWTGVPAGTRELALLVEDPDASSGTYVHWSLYGLDPSLRRIAAGAVPRGAKQGESSAGDPAWTPPCPPEGKPAHRYAFTLFALRRRLDLPNGAKADDVSAAIDATATAQGRLVARFGRG